MARRRLSPAQPGYLGAQSAPETKSALLGAGPPIAKVSGQSAEAAALRELAEGIETARRDGRMIVEVPLAEIAPGYLLRDRINLDQDELGALKASIQAHGQRVPAEIAPLEGKVSDKLGLPVAGAPSYRFGLISGWRRLRALSELHAETGDVRFSVLRALIRSGQEEAEAYVSMVEENEIRVGLSYYERARLVAEATQRGVFPSESEALRQLFATASRAKRSKIASFIDIYRKLGDVLQFPADIPERLGLTLVTQIRAGRGLDIRAGLTATSPDTAAEELALLQTLCAPPQKSDVSRAKQESETLCPGVVLKTRTRRGKLEVILSGDQVTQDLIERLRTALSDE